MAIFRPNNGYFWNERQSGGLWTQLEIFEKKIEFLDAKKIWMTFYRISERKI